MLINAFLFPSSAVPTASMISETSSTIKASWTAAPNPQYDIAEYELALQFPVGTVIQTVRVPAAAGATHTFEGLQSGSEYGILVKAFHTGGIEVSTDAPIMAMVWTSKSSLLLKIASLF